MSVRHGDHVLVGLLVHLGHVCKHTVSALARLLHRLAGLRWVRRVVWRAVAEHAPAGALLLNFRRLCQLCMYANARVDPRMLRSSVTAPRRRTTIVPFAQVVQHLDRVEALGLARLVCAEKCV